MKSSFQPFLIAELKTGLFNYTEPWIRPIEAFSPLNNAFVYRGTLQKRNGYTILGRMSYRDNNIALGNAGTTYSGTLAVHPIVAGTFLPTSGVESFTDNGSGVLTGSLGGSGTINYTTGAWTLIFNAGVAANTNIRVRYTPNLSRPVMGLKQFVNQTTAVHKLISLDTRRASVYNTSTEAFDPIDAISQIIWVGDAVSVTTGNIATGWVAVTPYTNVWAPFSITVTDGTSTVTDNGAGALSASGNITGGAVNYATGVISVTFTAAPAITVSITMTAKLMGDYFTGNNSNFFNATNWLSPNYYPATTPGLLYLTNNADAITTFDGTNLARPPFPITFAHIATFTNDIKKCLDLDVYKNRLLVQLPTLVSNSIAYNQSIRWSAINSPTNLAADVAGNGGELSAPTDDTMMSSEFLRDQLIVLFGNSTWTFKFTGSSFDPFRFDKINNTKSTNASYGTIAYDERVTAIGSKGLIACDGVNVQRYDIEIIDQFLDINQNRFSQVYGLRFDTLNQSWILYPNGMNNATLSNRVLVYNFLENTWSTYDLTMSCLGLYFATRDQTWADFSATSKQPTTWAQANFPWDAYYLQELSPILLGGSTTGGYIYQMDDSENDHPASKTVNVPIQASITSSRWNPFTSLGEKVQFGYIDVYYEAESVIGETPNSILTFTFSVDNSELPCSVKLLTLDAPSNSTNGWKRIFINVVGEFLQVNIQSIAVTLESGTIVQPGPFKILGMILWAAPSGRLTPGKTVS